jgi:rhamnosyltransferase subunit B
MKIVLSTVGSLGDLHPKIALALALRRRGHEIVISSWEGYAEKIAMLGFPFFPLRPTLDPNDRELARELMDARKGPENIIKNLIFPQLHDMFEDLTRATEGADLLITGEIVYVAKSVAEKTGIKWISTSLAPLTMFSSYDPNVYPTAEWMETLRFLPAVFHRTLFRVLRWTIRDWFEPYGAFRRELGLSEDHDPIFGGKFSDFLHLAMFSKALAKPQPDWHRPTLQTGFCFYDGQEDTGKMPARLTEFLAGGEPPIVFTLGSAASMDARDFFEESARAARILRRRAVLLYGVYNEPPKILDDDIVGFDYAPYSQVFPQAACVVHQGGVGTTAQVLRAGVPALIMPYGHDQPDNAARCRRIGTAQTIQRNKYTAAAAAKKLGAILGDLSYRENAARASEIVQSEHGTETACDAIEKVLEKGKVE